MNYNAFVSALTNYQVNNSEEFINAIPQCVEAACRTIAREVDAIGLQTRTNVTASSGSPYVTLPSECFVINTVTKTSSGNVEFLRCRPYDYLIQVWPDRTSVGGNPTHYTRLNDTELYVAPTPTSTQSLELRYVTVSIPSSVNQTCYLLDRYPNLLMYRTMVEANLFTKDSADAQLWQTFYDREREAVENEARRNRRDDGTVRNILTARQGANNLKPDNH